MSSTQLFPNLCSGSTAFFVARIFTLFPKNCPAAVRLHPHVTQTTRKQIMALFVHVGEGESGYD
jgi:hypothetical protein